MNRINQLFNSKKSGILSLYFCAGHPEAGNTATVIKALEKSGIDMIEVGIPFSDPMADGPVIQGAATRSLRAGTTLRSIFADLQDIRSSVNIPLVLMGYLNPIYKFGYNEFFAECARTGIDGVIIPDLPFKDYMEQVKPIAEKNNVKVIMLITPETSDERIRFIDENTDGFIYMVSSAAVTGAQKEFDAAKQAYFNHVNSMNLRNPRMIGFGISNRQTLESAQSAASGCIIGSKFVQLLEDANGDAELACKQLYKALEL